MANFKWKQSLHGPLWNLKVINFLINQIQSTRIISNTDNSKQYTGQTKRRITFSLPYDSFTSLLSVSRNLCHSCTSSIFDNSKAARFPQPFFSCMFLWCYFYCTVVSVCSSSLLLSSGILWLWSWTFLGNFVHIFTSVAVTYVMYSWLWLSRPLLLNNRLSRSETLVPVLTWKSNNR